jgi:hypothetical protein
LTDKVALVKATREQKLKVNSDAIQVHEVFTESTSGWDNISLGTKSERISLGFNSPDFSVTFCTSRFLDISGFILAFKAVPRLFFRKNFYLHGQALFVISFWA